MGGVKVMKCMHYNCDEDAGEGKLFCKRHWDRFSRKRQTAIFEAWMHGDLDGVREEDDASSWD